MNRNRKLIPFAATGRLDQLNIHLLYEQGDKRIVSFLFVVDDHEYGCLLSANVLKGKVRFGSHTGNSVIQCSKIHLVTEDRNNRCPRLIRCLNDLHQLDN